MAKEQKNAGDTTEKVVTPATLEEANDLIFSLNQIIADQKATIEELSTNVKEVSELADANALIEELNAQISTLEKKLEEVKSGEVYMPEIEIKGVKYQVNNGTIHDGVKYTRDELAKNKKVCESILAISGQLTITPVEEEKEAE